MSEALRRFWRHRGGCGGLAPWRAFEIDDRVFRAAPILRDWLLGKTEARAGR